MRKELTYQEIDKAFFNRDELLRVFFEIRVIIPKDLELSGDRRRNSVDLSRLRRS